MENEYIPPANDAITINTAVDVLERAISSKKSTVIAQTGTTQRKSLWEQLLKIADVRKESILEKISLDLTLLELNVDHSALLTIQGYLRDFYEICLKVEDIQLLSAKKILEIEKESMERTFVEDRGIQNYFNTFDTDELLSTSEKIFMPTLTCPSMRYEDINTSNTHLCIVPGVEGLYSRFSELCERLKVPALVLQPDLDHPDETISQLAHRFVELLLKKVELKDNFYLLGYESGVLVALEMAAILEQFGLRGTVFCLGGSPSEILSHFQNNLSEFKTSQKLQYAVLKHMYFLMTNEDPAILDKLCKNLKWQEHINSCMDYVVGRVPHSIQYVKQWIQMAFTRLSSILQYTPEPKMLRSRIISLRPQYSSNCSDSCLRQYSDQNIILYQLQTPLSCAAQDLQCAAIINQHLDGDILKKFENINICETYIHNTSSLLSSK